MSTENSKVKKSRSRTPPRKVEQVVFLPKEVLSKKKKEKEINYKYQLFEIGKDGTKTEKGKYLTTIEVAQACGLKRHHINNILNGHTKEYDNFISIVKIKKE